MSAPDASKQNPQAWHTVMKSLQDRFSGQDVMRFESRQGVLIFDVSDALDLNQRLDRHTSVFKWHPRARLAIAHALNGLVNPGGIEPELPMLGGEDARRLVFADSALA